MKRITSLVIIFMLSLSGFSSTPDLVLLRSLLYDASESSKSAESFYSSLDKIKDDEGTTITGYRAMALMFKANYAWNPYSKLSHFLHGKKMLEEAIAKDSENVELRFFRLSIQTNAPFFLDYNSEIVADLNLINKHLPQLSDQDLKTRIEEFLILSSSKLNRS